MKTSFARRADRRRRRAILLLLAVVASSSGCALVPTWDDIHSATATVSDTVTGKARRNRQTKTFAEARILERRKDYVAAEQYYRELLKEEPQSRDCYHRLAVMASQQAKFDEANALYQQAIDCGRPTADLYSDAGYCHYMQSQLPQAEQNLKKALSIEPQHRAALNNLALVVGEAGNLDEAYRLFRQSNSDAEAEANFAFLCAQCGDLERAQQHYSRALSHDPEMRVATEALIQVTQRLQMQLAQQDAAQAPAKGDPNAVEQVGYDQPADIKPKRPLIEVFTAGPSRTHSSADVAEKEASSGTGAVGALMDAQSAGPNSSGPNRTYVERQSAPHGAAPSPPAMHSGFVQPQPPGQVPGANMAAHQPYSFPSQVQPQYLQPTMTASNGSPNYSDSTSQPMANTNGANVGPMMNAGGPFPPLVGGASMRR